MIEHEAWGLGIEGDAYGPFYDKVPGSREHIIRGDSSRPETIYHIRELGFNIVGVEKWPNSVEEGIRYLKSFQAIIIHPRCIHQIQEAKNYKHKVDQRTGDVLAEIVDKWNHCWDATRYAMQPAIAVAEETIEVSEDYQIEPISSSLDELD
jgi:phage terminase large subunit